MREIKTIAIVGFGLIGGSLGMAISERTDYTVLAIERDASVCRAAVDAGAAKCAGGAELLSRADLLILALSPAGSVEFLRENADRLPEGALVTDVCGIKRGVVRACEEICAQRALHFIGGHPMAGREHNGFANATGALFLNASYILTPTEHTEPAAVDFMKGLAMQLGCKAVTLTTPAHHDRMIAFTSQLPHVLAGAYVKSPVARQHKGYSAGSFRDVSRVATVDEGLWNQLFIENGDLLCAELDSLIEHLTQYKTAIAQQDRQAVADLIREGRLIKEQI